ncbi:hypothetical protein Tco_0420501 [Tanacetum coccineum]
MRNLDHEEHTTQQSTEKKEKNRASTHKAMMIILYLLCTVYHARILAWQSRRKLDCSHVHLIFIRDLDPSSAESKEMLRINILLQHIRKMRTQETEMMVAAEDSRSIEMWVRQPE